MMTTLRHAIRGFRRSPAFTIAAILSIAVGIGASSAIYSVASALLLHPLPYKDANRLVILWNRSPGLGIQEDWFSTAQYFDIKNGHGGFEDLAIAIGSVLNLTGDGEPERIGTIRMSSNLLSMLGARVTIGRLLSEREDRPGVPDVALLGHGTWLRRYGGDPSVLGRTLLLNGRPFQIVGVLDASFSLPREVVPTLGGAEDAEVVIPLPLGPAEVTFRDREDYNIVGRLKPGVTVAAAQAEMDTITARLRREHPDLYPPNGGLTFGIVPLREQVVGDVRRAILVLAGAVAFVLLIACANVANLQLARALARRKELSVRAALGAGRSRLAAQMLGESLVLAAAGGVLGVGVALAGVAAIRQLGPGSVPRLREIAVNPEVILFTALVSIISGVLFGVVPALRVSRADVAGGLNESGRGAAAGSIWTHGSRTRRLLVAAEVALSVVLLAGAGLLVRSLGEVRRVWPGFNARQLLTFELNLNGPGYADVPTMIESYRKLLESLARVPGVKQAGAVSALPLSQMFAWGGITVEGRVPAPGEAFINADLRMVAGRYFDAMEIPLVEGRLFDDRDTRTSPKVVIVDDAMARQLWPGGSPLGRRVRVGIGDTKAPWLTVVGVVGRVKQYTLDGDSRIAMYFPQPQYPARSMNVVLRSGADPTALAASARRALHDFDPALPIYRVRTMEERVGESLARRRFATLLLSLFAVLALGLALIGVYGVMAYAVDQGRRDLGIRLALGATPRGIVMLVLRQGLAVTLAGLAVGLTGAALFARILRGLLFQVAPLDPLTFLGVPAVMVAVALAALYAPARRAASTDPLGSLKSE
jgi:predicted permease